MSPTSKWTPASSSSVMIKPQPAGVVPDVERRDVRAVPHERPDRPGADTAQRAGDEEALAAGGHAPAHGGAFEPARVDQPADALDLDRDRVAVVEQGRRVAEDADPAGRARGDDVTRLEAEGLRAVADDLGHAEVHLPRVGSLADLVADATDDVEVLWVRDLVGRHQHGTHRAEGIERLATHPLAVAELEIPCRDVVEAGVPEDGAEGLRDRDVARAPADDHGELSLVIDLGGERRVPADLGAVTDDRARPFAEDKRRRRGVRTFLADVVAVVAPDRDDLPRARDGCQQLDIGNRSTGRCDPGVDARRAQLLERAFPRVEQLRHGRRASGQDLRCGHPSLVRDDAERVADRVAKRYQAHRGIPTPDARWSGNDSTGTGSLLFSILAHERRSERYSRSSGSYGCSVGSMASTGGRPGALFVTIIFVVAGIALQLCLGLGLAILCAQAVPWRRFFRVAFLIPLTITPVGIGYMFLMMTDTSKGPLEPIWVGLGLATSRG